MISFQVRPERVRAGEWGAVRAFFDYDVGFRDEEGIFTGILTVDGARLIKGGKGFFVSNPSRVMTDKEGKPLKNDEGNNKYADIVSKYFGEDQKPTKLSYKFFDDLAAAVVEILDEGKAVTATEKKKYAKATNEGKKSTTSFDNDEDDVFSSEDAEDDELPF